MYLCNYLNEQMFEGVISQLNIYRENCEKSLVMGMKLDWDAQEPWYPWGP